MNYWQERYRKQGYNTVANRGFSQRKFEDSLKKIEALLKEKISDLVTGKRVLDFGCGWGRVSKILGGFGAEVYGIDIVEWAVTAAKEYYPEGKFTLVDPDEKTYPFEDGFFDAILTWTVLQHLPNEGVRGAAREFNRLLGPEGMLITYENISQKENTLDYLWFRSPKKYKDYFPDMRSRGVWKIEHFDGNDEVHLLMVLEK